jgi:alpha-beta hydrolase superfamily lysophospholipase
VTEVARTARRPGVHVRPARGETCAVVLVLHGGTEVSQELSDPKDLSALRMRPFARALHRRGARQGVAVWSVRYRVRGWNGAEMSPVHDVRWALAEVRRRHGSIPVALVGHSMGGRTAVSVLDEPDVVSVVALAPWLPVGEPAAQAAGKQVLVAHGTRDTRTSPGKALQWAERARAAGAQVTFVSVERSGHALLRRARLWTALAVGFALGSLEVEVDVGRTARRALASTGKVVV